MAGLQDIAKVVHLNVSVVSRALSASPEKRRLVKKETRECILAVAKQLNYIPDRTASFLRQKKAPTILCFLPGCSQRLVGDLVIGISEAAAVNHYPVNFYFGQKEEDFDSFCGTVKKTKHSGIITYPPCKLSKSLCKELEEYHTGGGHILILNALSNGGISERRFEKIPQLQIDDQYGGQLVARHFLDRGGNLFFHTPLMQMYQSRYQGFASILKSMGKNAFLYSAVKVKQAIQNGKKTGIFAFSDADALNIMFELKERGLQAGQDYLIAGYDDQFLSARVSPSLTTVSQSTKEEGRLAVEKMIRMLDGEMPENEFLTPYLIVRESTGGKAPDLDHPEREEKIR